MPIYDILTYGLIVGLGEALMATTIRAGMKSKEMSRSSVDEAEKSNTAFRWVILVGLILAAAMEVLDTTIINVALPQMAGNLGTTTQEIAWVSTGYILSNVVVLPMTAFLNSFFGRKNYLVGSIILFTVSSFFCGTSTGLVQIIFWRVLQGAGGAALISTAQATLVQIFPKEEQAAVQPLFLMGLVVFPTLGADTWRLYYRCTHVELVLLHQYSDRDHQCCYRLFSSARHTNCKE